MCTVHTCQLQTKLLVIIYRKILVKNDILLKNLSNCMWNFQWHRQPSPFCQIMLSNSGRCLWTPPNANRRVSRNFLRKTFAKDHFLLRIIYSFLQMKIICINFQSTFKSCLSIPLWERYRIKV